MEFFHQHPRVLHAYNQARWDCDTSLSAQKKNMTNIDFLRFRLEHGGNIDETNPERLKTTILASIELLQKLAEEEIKYLNKPKFRYNFSPEEIERFVAIATKIN